MNAFSQVLVDIIEKITKQNSVSKRQIVYIEGGYYDTRFGPNEFSTNTLRASIEAVEEIIKKRYKITRVVLGVLINNIGITCGEDVCVIAPQEDNSKDNEDTVIPEVLENMLQKSKVAKGDQVITNERTLRNRGIRTIKEIVREPEKYFLETEVNANDEVLYSTTIKGTKIPLAIQKGERWVARCPLIMGQHYIDLYIKNAKKYGNSTNQLLIDMCEMYDRHKVNNGARVALLLLQKRYGYDVNNIKIVNFSFNDDELTQYEYDVNEGGK